MVSFTDLLQRGEKTLERLSLAYSLWPLIPAGAVGIASGWAARGSSAINQLGTFGWLAAGVLGFALTSIGFMAVAIARDKLVLAKATADWARKTDAVNPMATHFNQQRITISDLAHPITQRVVGKTFTHCELIGPANIIFLGSGTAANVGFIDCDIVVVKENVFVRNITVLEDCNFVGGKIWKCTVMMPEVMFKKMEQEMPGLTSITHLAPEEKMTA